MTMTMIQVILYLSVAIHLVYCWPMHSRSIRNSDSELDCNDESEQDISDIRDIFEILFNTTRDSPVRLNITVL